MTLLLISNDVKEKLENRQVLVENIRKVLRRAEQTGDRLINLETGHFLACNREINVTFWVEYGLQEDGYLIYNAYSHRMEIGSASDDETSSAELGVESPWQCAKCDELLKPETIIVYYLRYDFPVKMLKCPSCGFVLVTEELALGRMAEVEQLLEDK